MILYCSCCRLRVLFLKEKKGSQMRRGKRKRERLVPHVLNLLAEWEEEKGTGASYQTDCLGKTSTMLVESHCHSRSGHRLSTHIVQTGWLSVYLACHAQQLVIHGSNNNSNNGTRPNVASHLSYSQEKLCSFVRQRLTGHNTLPKRCYTLAASGAATGWRTVWHKRRHSTAMSSSIAGWGRSQWRSVNFSRGRRSDPSLS